jgi:hypothetical protein
MISKVKNLFTLYPMAKVEIDAGICGMKTTVWATADSEPYRCKITIESDCDAIQKIGEHLPEVDALQEISLRRGDGPQVLQKGKELCYHSACPVPAGIIKAIEVAAGLALPADVSMKISAD